MPRKVFTAGEVLAAADVNEFLMDQTIMTFAGTAARGSAIGTAVEGMYAHLNDTDTLTYYNGSAWVNRIAPAGILQVVTTAKTDTFTTTSATFTTVTGLSATITPTSATSKILVFGQLAVGLAANAEHMGHFKITRGGTDFYIGDAAGSRVRAVFGGYQASNMRDLLMSNSIIAQDSPATTSPVTYQVETRRGALSNTVAVNRSGFDADGDDMARGASSITLMEVAG
jgi:hypothetical protein